MSRTGLHDCHIFLDFMRNSNFGIGVVKHKILTYFVLNFFVLFHLMSFDGTYTEVSTKNIENVL